MGKDKAVPTLSLNTVEKPVIDGSAVVAHFFNAAPQIPRDLGEGQKAPEPNRNTEPWYMSIPAFGIQFMLRTGTTPITGHIDFRAIGEQVVQFLDELAVEPEAFAQFRENREWAPQTYPGFLDKTIVLNCPESLVDMML